ncbi:uncharacterized protein TNCV_3355791 [Trichonephila clavipes]|nr:uncharacterized protein TNCV_3355791 [Trichonephila clavipes]
MKEYETLGHMTPVENNVKSIDSKIYFLPHHAVMKGDSVSTKLRVVFDDTCKLSNGNSLNSISGIASSCSMAIVVKPFSRSSVVVVRKKVLIDFNLEKLLSPLSTLIGSLNSYRVVNLRIIANSKLLQQSKALGLTWNSMKDIFLFNLKIGTVLFQKRLQRNGKHSRRVCSIHIPRWIHTASQQITLHGFCDASELAYASVIYAVQSQADGNTKVTLLVAKSRVAPLKSVSIPRLELNGALLLARLYATCKNILKEYDVHFYAWTDSQVVLSWLSSHPRNWKPYIANRTSEILDLVPADSWRYSSYQDESS